MNKLNRIITAVAGLFAPVKLMANNTEAHGGGEIKTSDGSGEKGKGQMPDPGTGKSLDFKKMVLSMLGLGDDAMEDAVKTAYDHAMTFEPEAADKAIAGKVIMGEKAIKANEELAEKIVNLETAETTASNEKKTADEKIATLEQEKKDLTARAEKAEGQFANERQLRIKTFISANILHGRLTKAEGDAKEKELANSKTEEEFANIVKVVEEIKPKYTTQTANLGRTIAPGTASSRLLEMVNESQKADPKHDYNWHWSKVTKSEEGKAIIAGMQKSQTN
jgi:hypothetical protein